MTHRIARTLLLSLLATGCTVQSENGGDIRMSAPLLADQSWHVSERAPITGGRLCTVSSGEVEVTQRLMNGAMAYQVATTQSFDPGDRYQLIMGPHVYETEGPYFSSSQSVSIIDWMRNANILYTEHRKFTLAGHHQHDVTRAMTNKIALNGFSTLYQSCTDYVKGN